MPVLERVNGDKYEDAPPRCPSNRDLLQGVQSADSLRVSCFRVGLSYTTHCLPCTSCWSKAGVGPAAPPLDTLGSLGFTITTG